MRDSSSREIYDGGQQPQDTFLLLLLRLYEAFHEVLNFFSLLVNGKYAT